MIIFADKCFKNPVKTIKAFNTKEVIQAFELIESLKAKYYIVGYIRYEAFEKQSCEYPLLYFEVFKKYEKYINNFSGNCTIECSPLISFEEFKNAINKIKKEIEYGNTYEVNYTYDFLVNANCNDFELFEHLIKNQKTPYNFYIKNDYDTVLSFSPELFFELEGSHIITKPMKGTIRRGKTPEEDNNLIKFLQNDEKNRAENVMIVDLLRNDLGKISKTGSVKVSRLFDIETHKTLHQMTSQIEAELKDNITLHEIFKAIFPCGSITGAPKISTMKIIEKIEKGNRNIYCGAIGLISPQKTIFSVPIRILQKQNNEKHFKYRVGGAVVWDSNPQDEWEETITKTKFLNGDFKIIETILVKNGKPIFLKEHLERMKKSAEFFGFKFNNFIIKPEKDGIMRILLNKNGNITTEYKPENKKNSSNKIKISPIKIDSTNSFMYHKTTYRPWFYDSYQKIAEGEIFDEIFFNKKGELTEGARSNIVLQIDNQLYTPPISCGLLNGILRKYLNVKEKVLYETDLKNAQKIFCINSVRGIKEVKL